MATDRKIGILLFAKNCFCRQMILEGTTCTVPPSPLVIPLYGHVGTWLLIDIKSCNAYLLLCGVHSIVQIKVASAIFSFNKSL